ncbi:MAG: FAD-dependent monooxygenase [Actinomycetota bacterium]
MDIEQVPVLIVGGGGAGLTASLLMARLGVPSLLVSAQPGTSILPKAHVLNQRAMEIMKDCGTSEAIYALGTPPDAMSHTAFYAGFAGHPEAGRVLFEQESWGCGGRDEGWAAASPMVSTNLPQIRLEPILKSHAEASSPGSVRFHHEVVSIEQFADSVVATILDRASDHHYRVRADYVLACDGGRTIGNMVGIGLDGVRDLARTVSFYISSDLSSWAADPDVLLRWVWCPEIGKMVVMAPMGPDSWGGKSEEWVVHINYPIDDQRAFDDRAVEDDLRRALGIADHPMRLHLITRWTIGGLVADRFRSGRVFVAGDAAHRHPPTGALGLTSAMHDVHNLCWKIAYRLRGWAGDALLDTYDAERRPVDARNVERSLENSRAYAKMNHLLGFADRDLSAEDRWNALARMWSNRAEDADHRRKVLEVMAAQSQEFREHDVEYGYRHASTAVIDDGSAFGEDEDSDFRLHVPSTRPGSPLPHAWIDDWDGNRMSTLDLVDAGRFVVIAGEDGEEWCEAAQIVGGHLGVPIDAYRIGHARGDRRDPRLRWQEVRGISSTGMILVRPDRCIAARVEASVDDPVNHLTRSLRSILGT